MNSIYRIIRSESGQRSAQDILLLTLIVLGVFGRSIFFPFVLYDDDLHLYKNPILSASYWESIKYFWTHPYRGFYIPVTYSVWATLVEWVRPLDSTRSLLHLNPLPFHAVNVGLHLLNSLQVYFILRKFLKSRIAILLGVFCFALHPVQAESVAWATGLKELLSAFFALLGIQCFLTWSERSENKNHFGYLAFISSYVLGLLSKPGVIYLPLLLMGLMAIRDGYLRRRSVVLLLIPLLCVFPFVLLTSGLQPPEKYSFLTPFWDKPIVAVDALLHYWGKIVLPEPLIHDYGLLPELVLSRSPRWIALLGSASFLGALYLWLRPLFWIAVLFCLSYSPVLGFVHFAFQDFSTVSDHYMYLSLLLVALGLGLLIEKRNTRWVSYSAIGVLSFLLILCTKQVGYWQSSKLLLEHTLQTNPGSYLSRNNLAVQLETEGKYERALEEYLICTKLRPNVSQHHYNVGNLLLRLDRLDQAREYFIQTLRLEPSSGDALFNLGLISESRGAFTEAESYFSQAIKVQPLAAKGYIKFAQLLNQRGLGGEALSQLERAIDVEPFSSQAHFQLAKVLASLGAPKSSVRKELDVALAMNPESNSIRSEIDKLD